MVADITPGHEASMLRYLLADIISTGSVSREKAGRDASLVTMATRLPYPPLSHTKAYADLR